MKILENVPREKAFYFFTSIGNYTGEHASSLKEFIDKIRVINSKSLEFHLYRGDFEKWITEVLDDKVLAAEVSRVRSWNYSGVMLRNVLHNIVEHRYKQLSSSSSETF